MMTFSHKIVLIVAIAAILVVAGCGASVQAQERACTKEYIEELQDDLQGFEQSKKYGAREIRLACSVVNASEDWAGKALRVFGLDTVLKKAQDLLGTNIDPKSLSSMCKWFRKTTEKVLGAILDPDKEAHRIKNEMLRCGVKPSE